MYMNCTQTAEEAHSEFYDYGRAKKSDVGFAPVPANITYSVTDNPCYTHST